MTPTREQTTRQSEPIDPAPTNPDSEPAPPSEPDSDETEADFVSNFRVPTRAERRRSLKSAPRNVRMEIRRRNGGRPKGARF